MTIGKLIRGVLQLTGLLTIEALIAGVAAFFFLAPWLQYQDPPERADFIVPLAGNNGRLIKAAELYTAGLAPKILLGSERARPRSRLREVAAEIGYPEPEPAEFRLKLLEHLGVPRAATDQFGERLVSTVEEAEALKRYLGERRGTILLIPSPWQARRAKLIFERVMPDVRWVIVWPSDETLPERWWSDQDAAVRAVSEMAKLVYYWAGGAFRSAERRAGAN